MDSGLLASRGPGMTAYLQLQIPVLADHRTAPAFVPLRSHELKAGFLINVARGGEHAVGPERDLVVAGAAGEADAFASITEPTFSPSISAIQQRSRLASLLLTKSATICAHRPSNGSVH